MASQEDSDLKSPVVKLTNENGQSLEQEQPKSKKKWWQKRGGHQHRNDHKKSTKNHLSMEADRRKLSADSSLQIALGSNIKLIRTEPTELKADQIRLLQVQLEKVSLEKLRMSDELEVRSSQLDQLEENFKMVSDGTKLVAKRAMEHEQTINELRQALKIQTRQLELHRGRPATADTIEKNKKMALPVHLRAKFNDFLKYLLSHQKEHFVRALTQFVNNSVDQKQMPPNTTKMQIIEELCKIGNALTQDYVSELELRLNGAFDTPAPKSLFPKAKKANGGAAAAEPPTTDAPPPPLHPNSANRTQSQPKNIPSSPATVLQPGVGIESHQFPQMNDTNKQFQPSPKQKQLLRSTAAQAAAAAYNLHQSTTSTIRDSIVNQLNRKFLPEPGVDDESPQEPELEKRDTVVLHEPMGSDDDNSSPSIEEEIIGPESRSDNDSDDDDDDDETESDEKSLDMSDLETKEMLGAMLNMAADNMESAVAKSDGDPQSDGVQQMWTNFMSFKKIVAKPPTAPQVFNCPDQSRAYIELRDMLDALPYDLASSILYEQETNPTELVQDVLIQRGCWPMIRFSGDRHVALTKAKNIAFDDVLDRLKKYMNLEKDVSLLDILDAQNSTGYRLHMITCIVRTKNGVKQGITAMNFRVGRLWTAQMGPINESVDFWSSLEKPASMILLGPNTAEKSALVRQITTKISHRARTALVDTRSAVGGFTQSPLECGNAVRFFVDILDEQSDVINQTRSIYPQVVVVDEVFSDSDIDVLTKLQSEGISVIVSSNMHNLRSLCSHSVFAKLLPPADRLNNRSKASSHSHLSPHLVVLELNYSATALKLYKNIPSAVQAIRQKQVPNYDNIQLQWDRSNALSVSSAPHRREMSRVTGWLMKESRNILETARSRPVSKAGSPNPVDPATAMQHKHAVSVSMSYSGSGRVPNVVSPVQEDSEARL